MTVAALTPSVSYAENGVTLAFAVPFRFNDPSHLVVKRIGASGTVATLPYGSAWSATGGTTDAGGTVTLGASTAGATLTIERFTPRAQATDYETNDRFPAQSHEAALDRAMLIAQEQDAATADISARALRVPVGEALAPFPAAAVRAAKYMAFDAAGQPLFLGGTNASPNVAALVSAEAGGSIEDTLHWVTPEQFGAVADGVTDDRAAIQAAVDYASANNMGVRGRAGAVYACNVMPTSVHDFAIGPQPNIVIPAKAPPIDFHGATMRLPQGGRGFFHFVNFWPHDFAIGTVTADIAAGSYDFPLSAGEGALFQAGDRVLWQLGEIPYDKPETINWGHARVLSVAGDTVKLDRPLYEPFTVASVTTGRKRLIRLDRSWRKPVLRNVWIDGTVSATVGAENGANFYGAPAFECENVSGTFCGAGVIVHQYAEQAEISFSNADRVNTTQASYGKHISMAETRSINVRGGVAQAMLMGIACEADGEALVDGYHFINTYPGNGTLPAPNTVTVFGCAGRGKIIATNTLITGQGGFNLANVSNGQAGWEGVVQMRNVRVRTSGEAYSLPLNLMSGVLDYAVAGVRQVFNLDRPKVWRRRFRLKDGMAAATFVGPPGLVIAARAYTSPGLTVGSGQKISRFYFGKSAGGAANGTDMATDGQSGVKLVPGQWVEFPIFSGTIGGNMWTYRTNNQQVIITTDAAAGINATDDFVTIETLYVPEEGSKTFAYAEAYYRAEGDEYELYEALIAAVDLPSIAAGATHTLTLTIPDMANTDLFVGYSIAGGYGGLTLVQFECQTGQASLTVKNETVGAIDLSARDVRVLYAKPQAGA